MGCEPANMYRKKPPSQIWMPEISETQILGIGNKRPGEEIILTWPDLGLVATYRQIAKELLGCFVQVLIRCHTQQKSDIK